MPEPKKVVPVMPPEPGPTPPPGVKPPKTFTQAELDRIIKERLTREQTRFADYDDLKKAAEELSKLKEADLSEQELLKKQIAELEQAQADWDAQGKAREAEVDEKLLRAEAKVVAAELNFIKPAQAYTLAAAELRKLEKAEDGEFKGVKGVLEVLAKDNQHLIKPVGRTGIPPNKLGKVVTKDSVLEQAVVDARQIFNIKDHSKQLGGKE